MLVFMAISASLAIGMLVLADDASSPPDGTPSTSSLTQLTSQLRSKSPKVRREAIDSLVQRADRESTRLIMLYGIRGRSDEMARVSMEALDHLGRTLPIETQREWFAAELTLPLSQEFRDKKRRNADHIARVAHTAARVPTLPVYESLFAICDNLDPDDQTLVLHGILAGIDSLITREDSRFLDVVSVLEGSRLFATTFGLRRTSYAAAGLCPRADAVTFLLRQLPKESGELRGVIVKGLRHLTGHDHGLDHVAWSQWWTEQEAGFRFQRREASPSRYANSTPTYYGLPVYAKRLVFVLDTSKSMATGMREPRIAIAKRELIRAIEQLPETTLFNIVIFNSSVNAWHESLAPASNEWKASAAAFVAAQQPTGRTATYDALLTAMHLHTDVEAVYFLSDGEPSSGTIVQPLRILAAISQRNSVRRLSINAIGLFGGADEEVGGLEQFMQQLAARNFGEYRRID